MAYVLTMKTILMMKTAGGQDRRPALGYEAKAETLAAASLIFEGITALDEKRSTPILITVTNNLTGERVEHLCRDRLCEWDGAPCTNQATKQVAYREDGDSQAASVRKLCDGHAAERLRILISNLDDVVELHIDQL